jgi:hypothetical protein
MLTIQPRLRATMPGVRRRAMLKQPVRFTATTASQSAPSISQTGTGLPSRFGLMPALLTRMSTGPSAASTLPQARSTAARSATSQARRGRRRPARPR